MTRSLLLRLTDYAALASPFLGLAALVLFLVSVGSGEISDAAGAGRFYAAAGLALAAAVFLVPALVGLYLRQEERLDAFGVIAFVLALLGTVLAAGAQWTYLFVVPHFAPVAPELVNESTGIALAGFVSSYAALSIGWILFGLATMRARVFPRWIAIFVVAGAAIAFLPLPARTLVLALAVATVAARQLRSSLDLESFDGSLATRRKNA